MTELPAAFCHVPLAHRALHDARARRPENSRAAIEAAIAAGYGVEIDLQASADGVAMVFHDAALDRLTGETGPVQGRDAAALGKIPLKEGDGEGIPGFQEVLKLVAGQVPLLVELKDQHGAMGETDGQLERAAVATAAGYRGPIAMMSFNPHMVIRLASLAPGLPRGLTTCAWRRANWPRLSGRTRRHLRDIPDFEASDACFISHEAGDLDRRRVLQLRAAGVPVLCWTVRSARAEIRARRVACNVTFEGYQPAIPS